MAKPKVFATLDFSGQVQLDKNGFTSIVGGVFADIVYSWRSKPTSLSKEVYIMWKEISDQDDVYDCVCAFPDALLKTLTLPHAYLTKTDDLQNFADLLIGNSESGYDNPAFLQLMALPEVVAFAKTYLAKRKEKTINYERDRNKQKADVMIKALRDLGYTVAAPKKVK